MSYTISDNEILDRETFDRLFSEASPYASHEVERVGGLETLKEGMWYSHQGDAWNNRVHRIDDYVVSYDCYKLDIPINGDRYMYLSQVMLGRDSNGSKSWWYSEDAVRAERKFLADNHQAGFVSALNPEGAIGRVAGNRCTNTFADRKHFSSYSWVGLSETLPEMTQFVSPNMWQVLKVEL